MIAQTPELIWCRTVRFLKNTVKAPVGEYRDQHFMNSFIHLFSLHKPIFSQCRFGRLSVIGILSAVLGGCVTDRQVSQPTPIDLLPDISVQADAVRQAGPTKIAVLLPLTGPNADIGQQLWDAATLSMFDSGRDDIVLVPHDTQGTPTGAIAAAEQAGFDGSHLVVGPLFSTSVSAARPVLARYGLRGIALSNNSAEARAPFFLIGNRPETQVDALVAYLESAGRHRIKLFGPDTPYLGLIHGRLRQLELAGRIQLVDTRLYRTSADFTEIAKEVRAVTIYDKRVRALKEFTSIFANAWEKNENPDEALQAALDKLEERIEKARLQFASFNPTDQQLSPAPYRGWGVTADEYTSALSDFLKIYGRQSKIHEDPKDAIAETITEFEQRETLGKPDFDAVLLPIGGRPLLVIAPMFDYYNATQPDTWLVGTDIWESTARSAPKDLVGGRFATTTATTWKHFQSRYREIFRRDPASITTAAYDAVSVAIAEKAETGRAMLNPYFLTRPQGFQGINGRFQFLASGTNERELAVVEVKPAGTENIYTWIPEDHVPADNLGAPAVGEPSRPLPPTQPDLAPSTPISALDQRVKQPG